MAYQHVPMQYMFTTRQALQALLFLALIVAGFFFSIRSLLRHQDKHTGPCQVTFRDASGRCYYFTRPNNELFITCFDNPPEFGPRMKFQDMVYRDDDEDFKHFVKVQFFRDAPLLP